MKYLIVGGVAGGASTAARLRRLDESAEIIMFERGDYISYANCGLPYYIGEVIYEREKLFVQTPESFAARFNIEARVRSEVERVNPEKKTITVHNLDSGGLYEETYDKLILSPGAAPVRPPLEGIDTEGIFTLRNVNDTDRVKEYIEEHDVKRALIVGAGFIGLEMAENLHRAGLAVSVIEMQKQVMVPNTLLPAQATSLLLLNSRLKTIPVPTSMLVVLPASKPTVMTTLLLKALQLSLCQTRVPLMATLPLVKR